MKKIIIITIKLLFFVLLAHGQRATYSEVRTDTLTPRTGSNYIVVNDTFFFQSDSSKQYTSYTSAISTNEGLEGDSDDTISSQQAIKAYVDGLFTNRNINSVSASYDIVTGSDYWIGVTNGAANDTIILPTPETGLLFIITKVDAGAGVTIINGTGGETMNGAPEQNLANQFESYTFICDGSNWFIIAVPH